MGRDDHKGKSNQSQTLPQTPKNQIIQAKYLREEIAKEFLTLNKSSQKHSRKKSSKKKI